MANASRSDTIPAAIGLRAQRGGGVAVAVALEAGMPRVLLSRFLTTADEGDRLTLEPYHVAASMPRDPEGYAAARLAVATARDRQDALARDGLGEVLATLRQSGVAPVAAVLLVNRAGWVTDLLDYSLAFADHPPVAEGLAVRESFRSAIARHGLERVELDEKSLNDAATDRLSCAPPEIEAQLKRLGEAIGRPWRKEQKQACLAAWTALAERAGPPPL